MILSHKYKFINSNYFKTFFTTHWNLIYFIWTECLIIFFIWKSSSRLYANLNRFYIFIFLSSFVKLNMYVSIELESISLFLRERFELLFFCHLPRAFVANFLKLHFQWETYILVVVYRHHKDIQLFYILKHTQSVKLGTSFCWNLINQL